MINEERLHWQWLTTLRLIGYLLMYLDLVLSYWHCSVLIYDYIYTSNLFIHSMWCKREHYAWSPFVAKMRDIDAKYIQTWLNGDMNQISYYEESNTRRGSNVNKKFLAFSVHTCWVAFDPGLYNNLASQSCPRHVVFEYIIILYHQWGCNLGPNA